MATSTRPHKKCYQAGEEFYSLIDLLHIAVDPEYQSGGIPRISDFHLKVGQPIRFRLDDDLETITDGYPLTEEVLKDLLYPLLSDKNIKFLEDNPMSDLDSGFELPDAGYSFRLNVFRDRDGLATVIRLLPPNIPEVFDIGFPSDDIWDHIVNLNQGLCLFAGVTGSGKSTTIASLIKHMTHTRSMRIITLEDPVEYIFRSDRALISQREVGTQVKSFAHGLRSALRENPDLIYIGEMRDMETAQLALSAAETGHLVFATLHTRNAMGALTRIVDIFPTERTKEITMQLSFSLATVICQKLVPRKDGSGRVVAMEVMKNTGSIGNLIRTGNWHQIQSMIETGSQSGMISFEQCLLGLVQHGLITEHDAKRYASDDKAMNYS